MLSRHALTTIEHRLARFPAVVLLGSRQVGKTTLARLLAARQPGTLMLDLERESDRAQLAQPELFFARHRERLVVLDEVQALPGLFAALRPEIDADRRPGRFLLLGSVSGRLLRARRQRWHLCRPCPRQPRLRRPRLSRPRPSRLSAELEQDQRAVVAASVGPCSSQVDQAGSGRARRQAGDDFGQFDRCNVGPQAI